MYVIKKNKVIDYPLAYLKQMIDKECARYYRKKAQAPFMLDEEASGFIEDRFINIEIEFLNKIVFEEVFKEINKLKETDQIILAAYFRFEMSFKEIAEELKCSENAVRLHFYRLLKKLRNFDTK